MADKSAPAPVATAEEVAAYAAEQEAEWGTYICTRDHAHNGVPAYREGDPISVTNVKRYGYDQGTDPLAVKVSTKAGQEVAKRLHAAAQSVDVSVPIVPVALNVPLQ